VAVDIENPPELADYLRHTGRIDKGERIATRVLAGGVSNRTVLVERESGDRWVLKQALAKLRVPVDWFCPPERIEREALGMEWLNKIAPPQTIPPLIFCDAAEHVLGMQAVAEPHENWKTALLDGRIERDHFVQFGELIGIIHARAEETPDPLARYFDDRSYFEMLRLEPYYSYTSEQVPEAQQFLNALIVETRATRRTIVHGDFSPKNVLVQNGRLILIDHEVIHWGDPAFDIGFSMAHLLSKARHLPDHRATLVDGTAAYWSAYRQVFSPDEAACVRHTLGCLLARVAGRSQLEYLSAHEKTGQRGQVAGWMKAPPVDMADLIELHHSALED
jgi:5-methylthioribose kinase